MGCFRVSIETSSPMSKNVRPFSEALLVLLLFYCNFNHCSTLCAHGTISFTIVYTVATQLSFLPLFARMHRLAMIVIYTTFAQLLKRIPHIIIGLACHKHKAVKQFLFLYAYFYIGCITCYTLHTQWLVFRMILLSRDVEINPGPHTLNFCTWNLNSIAAHDFLRVSLIEAYNSVYNYDLIGIVETHLDTTINEDRLALDGYTFFKSNHPR